MSMEALGKALGIEIKPVQEEPQWLPETRDQLLAITDKPNIPQFVWNVMGGGLNDHWLNVTNQNIMTTTKLMRARLLHIREAFNQLNLPLTYATYTLHDWIESPKRNAERALLQRFQRSQGGGRNFRTPGVPEGTRDWQYEIEVARARGHVHTATMLEALRGMEPPPPGPMRYGYVLPLTPQEIAVSQEAAKEQYVENRLPLADRAHVKAGRKQMPYALYPHQARLPDNPALSLTYINLVAWAEAQYLKASNAARQPSADPKAAQQAATDWGNFLNSVRTKWGRQGASPLYAKDQEAQKGAREDSPQARWAATVKQQYDDWVAAHPEVLPELAHAKKLIRPDQRWLHWYSGQPMTTQGSDGTRLDYLIAIYDPATHGPSAPMTMDAACRGARAQAVTKATQTGKPAPTWPKPC
jgi:hypothetical protein